MRGVIHHIEINVTNLSHSRKFWEWLLLELGYKKFQEWSSGISFKLQDTYLVFTQCEQIYLKNNYHRKNVGLNHLAFHAGTKETVDILSKLLKEKGVKILYLDKSPFAGGKNHYAIYFEDPDRIKVEVAV